MTPKLPEASRPSVIRTFLIADIRGYTRFTNELGDEAGSRLAAKFAQISFECVEAHGGVVLELRGDEAMCVFDSARAALRCAVELQDAFADETRLEPHLPLRVGIGLDAGEAVPVGDGYRGSAINLAARLCSAAEAGAVIATEGLVHLAGRLNDLSYVGLDGRPLKGFDEPVPAWLVSAERPHEHPDAAAGGEPGEADPLPSELEAIVPLVGREADLRWLGWFWRRARHGHGGAVAISGPHGIGRTRLAAEMAALAHGQGASARYVHGGEELDLPDGPALVVVDDLERIAAGRARGLVAQLARDWTHRLVILTHADAAPSSVRRQVERIVPGERRRVLGPLDVAAVNQVARFYLERPEDEPPTQLLLEESEGIPAAIHRVASQWARAAAARRLGESARRTSRERRDLRAAEATMIDDVASLELARERSRLFVGVEDAPSHELAAVGTIVCPYKGLATFEAADADFYFGRERLIAELIARMVGSAFIGLVGASGSGKSSALQAGLMPALAGGVLPGSDEWIQVPMRPADHPMRQLRAALARSLPADPGRPGDPRAAIDAALAAMAPAQRLLLVIDQFEELFTSATDEAERSDFIEAITEARPGLKVLVALRADHYERCAAYPRLARLLGADQVLVGPLTTDEIAAIIRHPAERVGLRVEAELVDSLVADVGTEPGGLPLLSTALLELWEARDGGRLTLAAYRATGGVRGAVARLAEAAYAQLDEAQQTIARGIFLRLAGEGDGGSIVRRRVTSEELDVYESPNTAAVTAELTAARLLTASDGYVEVAHEALLREWPRLREWIDEDSSGRQLRLHLMGAARAWDEGGREPGDLYHGARIAAVLEWSAEHGGELNAVERAFIDESRAAAEREAERQRRTNRRLRGFLVGTAALLMVAVVAGLAAMTQAGLAAEERERAEENAMLAAEEADRADEEARVARARELWASSIAVLDRDPELTLLLAMEASKHGVAPPPEAVTALHAAIQRSRSIFSARLPSPDIPPIRPGVEISPDGDRVWATAGDGRIFEYSVADGTIVREFSFPFSPSTPGFPSLAASPDGGRLAHVDPDAVVHVYDLETGAESTHQAPGYHPDSVVWSPDGRAVATITYDDPNPNAGASALVSVVDLTSGEVQGQWTFDFMFSVSFAPEGDRLFGTACPCNAEEAVFIMDLESGDVSLQVGSEEAIVQTGPTAARFSPDGATLATAGLDRRVNLWDTETGRPVTTLAGHTQPATDIVFSPDGTLLATTSRDGSTKVWDIAREEMILDLVGQGGIPAEPSFSDDGSRLATTSSDLSIRVWDLTALRASEGDGVALGDDFLQVRDLDVQGGVAALLGRACRVGVCPGTVGVTVPGRDEAVTIPDQVGAAIALSPDGRLVFSQADAQAEQFGGPMHIYDATTGEVAATLADLCPTAEESGCSDPPAQVQAATFDRAGSRVALGGFSFVGDDDALGWWGIWSVDGRLEHLEFDVLPGTIVDFDPAGDYLAVSDFSSVDIRSAQDPATTLATLPVTDVIDLEFSPDGGLLALASPDNLTRLYETEGWTLEQEVSIFAERLSFSADGERLLLSDGAGLVRIWDVPGNTLLYTVPVLKAGPGFTVNQAYFLSDTAIVAADSRTLISLVLDPEALLRLAPERTSRTFTSEECQTYLHADDCPAEF